MRGGASRTAEVVCFIRALEALRPNPVLVDPYAVNALRWPLRVTLPAIAWLSRVEALWNGWPGLAAYIAARHRWMDDQLERAIEAGCSQVLVLGAGYDSRSQRFPGPVYWEVDHPATAARKRRVGPRPDHQVTVDFTCQDLEQRLLEEGFVAGEPTFVVWEGVTMYLTRAAVLGSLEIVRRLVGPDSTLVFDAFAVPDGHDWESDLHRLSPALMPLVGEPVSFFLHPDDVHALLAAHGWAVESLLDAGALRAAYTPDRVVYAPCYVVAATPRAD